VVVEEPSADAAVNRLEVGDIDIYAYTVSNPEIARRVTESADLDAERSFGSYNELTFNTSGPVFDGTGKLNPFAVPEIRAAMNMLIDREYIAQEIMGGLAVPRWVPFNNASTDNARYAEVVKALELEYAFNRDRASEIIAEEMAELGATMSGNQWQYNGEPVNIIILIRTEDERRDVGDYVANQLEDIGFATTRDYKTAAEASPIWTRTDPAEGLFHIYTGGWITTVVPRDLGDNFSFFYTARGLSFPLWQAYTPVEEFDTLAERLENRDYQTMDERGEMMRRALELSLEDSSRIWLVDRASITPKRAEMLVASDLYGAVYGSRLWPYTLRRGDEIGGSVTIAMPSILTEPWNALNGTNWIYDQFLIRGTGEFAVNTDPFTGLNLPQRIERAEVVVQQGLPVTVTHDWVTLEFANEIQVPDDAWADWDAAEQRFITFAETNPEETTALRKSTVYYPSDLYTSVKWHDGSNFSIADVVMFMILTFDRAKEESPYYDASVVPAFESFMSAFKGVKIVSTDPLVIETYSDLYEMDAEQSVTVWWPMYLQGQAGWHALALGLLAEENNQSAFTAAKSDENQVEWLSYIAGPTVDVLNTQLETALAEGYIPFEATLGEYITADDAQSRYENLEEFHRRRGHFWVGTGAFYLERAFPVEGTVILRRNADFPDTANKWDRFSAPAIAEVELDGPGRVTIGQEAVYEVFVEFDGEPYAVADIDQVKYLVFNARGELAQVGEAEAVEDGVWEVTLPANLTSQLEAGSNRLEVVVVSTRVAVPSSDSLQFVTAP
jgi:peptide/nickel transport system substrate-binding protein